MLLQFSDVDILLLSLNLNVRQKQSVGGVGEYEAGAESRGLYSRSTHPLIGLNAEVCRKNKLLMLIMIMENKSIIYYYAKLTAHLYYLFIFLGKSLLRCLY